MNRFTIDLDAPAPAPAPKRRRQRFQVKSHFDPITGLYRKDVFVDDKLFEWEVDEKSWKKVLDCPPDLVMAAKTDILRHFCVCLSDFLGREVTPGQVVVAIQTGWI